MLVVTLRTTTTTHRDTPNGLPGYGVHLRSRMLTALSELATQLGIHVPTRQELDGPKPTAPARLRPRTRNCWRGCGHCHCSLSWIGACPSNAPR